MRSQTTFITLGVLTALIPFSGLPGSWRNILSIIFGLSIASIALYYSRTIDESEQEVEIKDEQND